ncbi:FliI/YscN family ATPase [Rhodobacteraceae bacterium 2CG4]|uniref:FliI/YscN family ATPase n=1 Tax=Halovulum marinum TaxID=2662447 RepID=A0A6L5Z6V5_9RHOB|nr:FliI/YscN family ATPase [Halovulum marinum]MSU91794.1 FliI/YscN family ATPase [Halovulum marinum]
MTSPFSSLSAEFVRRPLSRRHGRIAAVRPGSIDVSGLGPAVRVGDRLAFPDGAPIGEVIALDSTTARAMTYHDCTGIGARQEVILEPEPEFRPCAAWQGRIVDAFGEPLDGRPLPQGDAARTIRAAPPPAAARRPMGRRMRTGVAALDTMLPLVRGQRIGVFAGSGVGKSTLLASIARAAEADRVVLALVGERGRELRHFTDSVLGAEGLARSVVVAATSDQSPLVKRRAAWSATAVAEHFRDQGEHVLLIVDSLTRMAEAHREVALTAGEPASLRAFPPSTGGLIAALAERAGPGAGDQGDITAVFSVLVAGSDMEEPVADMSRGVLDGHVVLDRAIAERGRFPAIDVRRSVSRSLPGAASERENTLIALARRVLGTYETAAPMVQAGLYTPGADPDLDAALRIWPKLDALFARTGLPRIEESFQALGQALDLEPSQGPSDG